MSALLQLLWNAIDVSTVTVLLTAWWITQWLIWKGYIFAKGRVTPGIYGLPVVGIAPYFLFCRKTTLEKIHAYADTYGPVFRTRVGIRTATMVIGTKAVREAMLSDALLGRPPQNFDDEELSQAFDVPSLITLEGDLWKKHRRFALTTLRDLGFGKTPIMEQCLQEELRDLVAQIEAKQGQPFNSQDLLVTSTSNNIASLVFGERLPYDHPKRKELDYLLTAFNNESGRIIVVAFIPKLLKILYKLNIGIGAKLTDVIKRFRKLVENEILDHRKSIDKDNPRDFIDYYLIEQEKDAHFTDALVSGNAMGFFQAGSITVRVTVEYLLHLTASLPEVQRRVQAEIDEVTGRSREVTWADSRNMIYTMAVIAERHRYFTVAPFGVNRRTLQSTVLCGYDIGPQEEVVLDIDSVHYDPETFPDPYEFRPERFISNGKLINTEKVWAFSIGKRACPGESLAVLETFLYFANLLQHFTIAPEQPGGQVKLPRPRCIRPDVIPQKLRFIKRE